MTSADVIFLSTAVHAYVKTQAVILNESGVVFFWGFFCGFFSFFLSVAISSAGYIRQADGFCGNMQLPPLLNL